MLVCALSKHIKSQFSFLSRKQKSLFLHWRGVTYFCLPGSNFHLPNAGGRFNIRRVIAWWPKISDVKDCVLNAHIISLWHSAGGLFRSTADMHAAFQNNLKHWTPITRIRNIARSDNTESYVILKLFQSQSIVNTVKSRYSAAHYNTALCREQRRTKIWDHAWLWTHKRRPIPHHNTRCCFAFLFLFRLSFLPLKVCSFPCFFSVIL